MGNALSATIRTQRTPPEVLGRATAAWRTLSYGAIPLGAASGGFLADAFGLRAVLLGSAVLLVGISGLPWRRVVRTMREMPSPTPPPAPTARHPLPLEGSP